MADRDRNWDGTFAAKAGGSRARGRSRRKKKPAPRLTRRKITKSDGSVSFGRKKRIRPIKKRFVQIGGK